MLAFLVLVAGLVVGPVQEPPPDAPAASPQGVFRSGAELVTLNVAVTDRREQQVTGLGREDFVVIEEGQPQEIRFFASSEVPLDVVLLIDTSSSMSEKLATVQEAARRFLATLRPADRAAVVEFNTQVKILQAFTSDHPALEQAVAATRARGNTALHMGLYVALDYFSRLQREGGDVRRSAIIVLSDGEDTASLIGEEEVRERARRVGVPLYFISLLSSLEEQELARAGGRRRSTPREFALRTLSLESGARAFFPAALDELNGVYQAVARELSHQYTIAYSPENATADGRFRRVVVRVPGRPDARPHTRAGYYAPGSTTRLR